LTTLMTGSGVRMLTVFSAVFTPVLYGQLLRQGRADVNPVCLIRCRDFVMTVAFLCRVI